MKLTKREVNKMYKYAKEIVSKKTLSKIKKVKELEEKYEIINYSLKRSLNERIEEYYEKLEVLKEKCEDIFDLEIKIRKLELKIKVFLATVNKKDFNNVLYLIKYINKEIK